MTEGGITPARLLRSHALNMWLISFPEWRQRLPGPLLQRLERFYRAEEVHEAAPAPAA